MMKTLRFMLFAVLTMLCGTVSATEVTWDASSGDALTTIFADSNIKLIWEESSGDMSPKYSNGSVYFYNGNRVTVAGATNDVQITRVVFTFASANNSLITVPEGQGSYSSGTWTGEQNSVTFRAAKQTGNRNISSITVTYTGGSSEPVEQKAVLAITQDNIASTYDMDTNPVFVVYYENQGNKAASNAKLTLYVDNVENASKNIGTLAIGTSAQNFWNAKYDVSKFEAGEHQVKLTLTADETEAVSTESKTVTFSKKAPEATFTVSAENVTVPYGAASYTVTATVTNTSETVNATGVQVLLQQNLVDVAEPQSIDLAAGESNSNVTFTVNAPDGGFTAGTKTMFVMVKAYDKTKASQEITVTFEAEPVQETKDLAITAINGQIKLEEDTPQLQVLVQNKGTVDIENAPVTLKNGETLLGEGTVNVKAGQTGWVLVSVNKNGLEAGTINVTATVTVEDDATPADNSLTQEVTVVAVPTPEATFTVSAENVTVPYGAANYTVTATVTNTSETVDATGVQVLLQYNLVDVAEPQSIDLAAGESNSNVTFTVNAPDGGFTAGTKTMYVMVKAYDKTMTMQEITVTFEPEPEEEVKDLAVTQVSCEEIDLAQTTNYVTVAVQNNGTVDITDAPVIVKATIGGTEKVIGTKTISAKAGSDGNTGLASVSIDTTGMTVGTLTLTIMVVVEDDATAADNSTTKEVNVVDTTTGIEAVKAQLKDMNTQVYTLKGEKVNTITKGGLYLINGRKVVVK